MSQPGFAAAIGSIAVFRSARQVGFLRALRMPVARGRVETSSCAAYNRLVTPIRRERN